MSDTSYAKKLVSKFNTISDCDMTLSDLSWLFNNVQDTIDLCTESLDRRLRTEVEKNRHVVGVLEDLYTAIDTSGLDDDLRNDIREILKGDV
jgi:hypothetical protein